MTLMIVTFATIAVILTTVGLIGFFRKVDIRTPIEIRREIFTRALIDSKPPSNVTVLTNRDRDRLLAMLEFDGEPNDTLKQSALNYKNMVSE